MTDDLRGRVRELESRREEIDGELMALYEQLIGDDEDSFFATMANRFMRERDDARRELAGATARLASFTSDWEARFRAVEARFNGARTAIRTVVDAPLMPRDRVQSTLLLAYEKIRDFQP